MQLHSELSALLTLKQTVMRTQQLNASSAAGGANGQQSTDIAAHDYQRGAPRIDGDYSGFGGGMGDELDEFGE